MELSRSKVNALYWDVKFPNSRHQMSPYTVRIQVSGGPNANASFRRRIEQIIVDAVNKESTDE